MSDQDVTTENPNDRMPLDEPAVAVIREALRFAVWAAGEGIAPADGEPAEAPEEFLYRFGCATGFFDYDALPDVAADLLRSLSPPHTAQVRT